MSFLEHHTQKKNHRALDGGTSFDEEERVSFVLFFVNVQFKRRTLEEVVVSFKKGKRKKDSLMLHPKKKGNF